MLKNLFIVLILFSVVIISCNQENENSISIEETYDVKIIKTTFLQDGIEIYENPLEFDNEDFYIGITGQKIETNDQEGIIIINSFSSKEKYIQWGIKNDFPVALSFEIEDHLLEYAEENGVIEKFEQTGEVPVSYLEYEKNYFQRMIKNQGEARGITALYRDCQGGGSAIMYTILPVMFPGWNNVTSAYDNLVIYGSLTVFDRSFYRRRMATVWRFGWQKICFSGSLSPLNNRMSSAYSF